MRRLLLGALVAAVGLVASVQVLAQDATPGPAGPTVRSGTAMVEGGAVFYEVVGKGEGVVLIHDGMLHREVWDALMAPLAARFTVVRYDRRGYGKSPASTGPFSNLDDLDAVMTAAGLDKAALVGMSAGGRLAVDYTLAHPERVNSLVLVGAVVSGLGYSDHFLTRGGRLTPADRATPEAERRYWCERDPYELAPESLEARQVASRLLAANPQNLRRRETDRLAAEPRPALPLLGQIKVPTLIVVGDADIPDVHAHAGALEAGIRGARRVIISGSGHLVPLERPKELTDLLLGFLLGKDILAAVDAGRYDEAIALLTALKTAEPTLSPFPETGMNRTGYRLLQQGNSANAAKVFRLNVIAYPGSWNAHDSLGEALVLKGDTAGAIAEYERSVALNPESESGRAALERLRGEAASQSQ